MSEQRLRRGTPLYFGRPAEPMAQIFAQAIGLVVGQVPGIEEAYIPQCSIAGETARQVLVIGVRDGHTIPEVMEELLPKMRLLLPPHEFIDILPFPFSQVPEAARIPACCVYLAADQRKTRPWWKFWLSVLVLLCACGIGYEYGVVKVQVDGNELFFIREVRGNNYDSLVISTSPSVCQDLDSPDNYVFTELGPIHPYYRVQAGVLHLYVTSAARPPRNAFPVSVVQHKLSPLEYADVVANPQALGVIRIDVPLNLRKNC